MQQPQEIEVWYILPAIRRELAQIMIEEHGLSQKKVAEILCVTEPAISQYKKSKRAKEVVFTESTMEKIRKSAEDIIKDSDLLVEKTQELCDEIKKDMTLCKIHRAKVNGISSKCKVCLERLK